MSSGSQSSPAAKTLTLVLVAGLVALVLFVAVMGGALTGARRARLDLSLAGAALQASQGCVIAAPLPGLDPTQAVLAGRIVAAAFARSGENRAVARIALMVAETESGLRDLGPLPGNAGSLGLFQQRASQGWGSASEEVDPTDATAMFVDRLLATPGWSILAPWVAAQEVQRSAFTGNPSSSNGGSSVVGGNYEANWHSAGRILAAVMGKANTTGGCGQGVSGGVVGPPAAHGLPPGYAVPSGTGPAHAEVVAYALAQLGRGYQWGAAGPRRFDCSGLTMTAWARAGVALLHYTGDQQHEGLAVAPDELMAGDLVLTPGSDSPGPGVAGHVGIYLGYGLVLSAIDAQVGVAVQSWRGFTSGGLIALRDPDPADG